jgi:predicted transglutaminase-like cysteine proteinase
MRNFRPTRCSAISRRFVRIALFILMLSHLVGFGSDPVVAQNRQNNLQRASTLTVFGTARPTAAAAEFCRRLPSECRVDVSEPETIPLTPQNWLMITSVNRHVNASISGVSDQEHWGVEDRWDYPDDGKGDCEDIQLLKRKLLADTGLPRRAMRMAMVIDQDGAGHAVLLIRTDRGDLILDNRRDEVLAWHGTAYTFVKREGPQAFSWLSLNFQQAKVVVANR